MAKIKLYENTRWLTRQYVALKRTPKEIADTAGCSEATIYRKLKDIGLIKK